MLPKERLRRFVKYLGISENQFVKEIGLGNGFFTKGGHLNTDSIIKIADSYPELNLNWLILEIGHMIKPLKEKPVFSVNMVSESRLSEVLQKMEDTSPDVAKISEVALLYEKSNSRTIAAYEEIIRCKDALIEELKGKNKELTNLLKGREKN